MHISLHWKEICQVKCQTHAPLPTRPAPNPVQGPPKASRPHSHDQVATKHTPPTHHAKHQGHTTPTMQPCEHRKAQKTANPSPTTKVNPEVQSSRDTCPDSVRHEHRTCDTPTIGKTTWQARNNPHTPTKQGG